MVKTNILLSALGLVGVILGALMIFPFEISDKLASPLCEDFSFNRLNDYSELRLFKNYYFVHDKDTVNVELENCEYSKSPNGHSFLVCENTCSLNWVDKSDLIDISYNFVYHLNNGAYSQVKLTVDVNLTSNQFPIYSNEDLKTTFRNTKPSEWINEFNARNASIVRIKDGFPCDFFLLNGEYWRLIKKENLLDLDSNICEAAMI